MDIRGAHLGPYCYPLAIGYLDGGLIDAGRLVNQRYPLAAYADAFEAMHVGSAADWTEAIKVVLVP